MLQLVYSSAARKASSSKSIAPSGGQALDKTGIISSNREVGHPLAALSQAGLVTSAGYDTYVHRIVFPLEGNLYGRSISATAPPHLCVVKTQ